PTHPAEVTNTKGFRGVSAGNLAERLQLGLEDILLAFERTELDEQGVAVRTSGARYLVAQAREIALDGLQFRLDRTAIEFIRRQRLVGEHGAALRRHLGDAADDEDAPRHGLPFVNIDCSGADRGDQWRMAGKHAEIALGAGD